MRIITTIIITIIISGLAFANNELTPATATYVIANKLNAAIGCGEGPDATYANHDGACYKLGYASVDLHRSMVDLEIMYYNDIRPVTPWVNSDTGGAYRVYEVDGYGNMMMILAPFGEFGSVGGFIDLE